MKASHLMILLSLILIGCGKSGGEGTSTSSIPLKEGESLSTYLDSLSLDDTAPEGVGTLLSLKTDIYNQSSIGLCTWFLVGDNRAMTNSHCIPQNLKNNKALDCSKLLKGKIQTAFGERTLSCEKLIYSSTLSEIPTNNNDYALMEVSGDVIFSETFTLNRRGVRENETLSILTMNHLQSPSGIYSVFKKHSCLMKSSDTFGIISSAGASPLAGFLEEGTSGVCKTIGGNSGSPVVNVNGDLVGILHAGINEEAKGIEGVTKNLSIITNLRCQKFGEREMDQDYPSTCAQEKRVNGLDKEEVAKKVAPLIEKEIQKAALKQPAYLEYQVVDEVIGDHTIISFNPTCVKQVSSWSMADRSKIKVESNGIYINPMISQYELVFKSKMDYYGNLNMSVGLKTYGTLEFAVGALEMLINGSTEIAPVLSTGRATLGVKRIIKACEN